MPQAEGVKNDGLDAEGFTSLDEVECLRLLGGCAIGRVAVSIGAVPAVFPVNYGMLDGAVLFRTGQGTKLDAAVRNAVVAFEVDEIDPVFHEGWSVLVVGIADAVRDSKLAARAEQMAIEPWAPGPRHHLVLIRPEFISGRRIFRGIPPGQVEGGYPTP